IVDNIKNILSEGNPYTVYRLDVKSFYESFDIEFVKNKINSELYLSNETKKIVSNVLNEHLASGYSGLPRGLATSAIISEYMMKDFDLFIKRKIGVFYHARFVDDIFIVTNGEDDDVKFVSEVQKNLPKGLQLNKKKKSIKKISNKVSPNKGNALDHILEVDFLGYRFTVHEPQYDKSIKNSFRDIQIDISGDKVRKIKTRLVCAFKDFNDSKDFSLLVNRLRFLSSNFSVLDAERERKRLSGIFHNYHMTHVERSKSLVELDLFIKKAVLSGTGKVFSDSYVSLTQMQKYRLLKFSFKRGFQNCHYVYFKADKLKEIQECWKYV
ncbi:TPA: RNA-directed DNA polymerase, partial [Yersinia enterocolitica]|nr:RNA-directed DNA polymerase [Yersinia enterocolitica]